MTRSRGQTASDARLDALIEEATVDCYNEEEQVTGLFTMLEGNLAVPFQTSVLGVSVTVASVDLTDNNEIVAICQRDGLRQAIPILYLPLPAPAPDGAEWIDAYRRWLG
jgi:Calcium binding